MQTQCQPLVETDTVIDGVLHREHICGVCPHGYRKGYLIPATSHPRQGEIAHRALEGLRCEDHSSEPGGF